MTEGETEGEKHRLSVLQSKETAADSEGGKPRTSPLEGKLHC